MSIGNTIPSTRHPLVVLAVLIAAWPIGAMAGDMNADLLEQYRAGQEAWPAAEVDEGVDFEPLDTLPETIPYPEDNPYSDAKRELGKHLFFDRRLSRSHQIACASCHDPDLGWADGKRQSIGHNRLEGDMNAPTVVNSAYLEEIFWDGRVDRLETQVVASWSNPREMAADPAKAAERIAAIDGYSEPFEQAFGDSEVTVDRIAAAVSTFMRSLRFTNTDFDRFMRGEADALDDQQIRGLHLFRTRARCINCHHGPQLSDGKYHHLGTSFHNVGNFEGRYRLTGDPADVGAFRTPTLRGALSTTPFMHNGMVEDLDMLMALYNMGWWQNADLEDKGNDIPTATLSPLIKPLELTPEEMNAVKAFMESLDGHMPYMDPPEELQ